MSVASKFTSSQSIVGTIRTAISALVVCFIFDIKSEIWVFWSIVKVFVKSLTNQFGLGISNHRTKENNVVNNKKVEILLIIL